MYTNSSNNSFFLTEESGDKIPEEPEKEEQEAGESRMDATSVEGEKMKEALVWQYRNAILLRVFNDEINAK